MRKLCVLALVALLISYHGYSVNPPKQKKKMKPIEFIPKEFNDVELDYPESGENPCSPISFYEISINTIVINTPQTIICRVSQEGFTPIIPVCGICSISSRRADKYDYLSAKVLHIRKTDQDTIYSGKLYDKRPPVDLVIEDPMTPEEEYEREREREEAKKLSDEELDTGSGWGDYINVNLMEYIEMPFLPGKYEIYMSFWGLESNHTIVEIVME